jgi:hypothetical protein
MLVRGAPCERDVRGSSSTRRIVIDDFDDRGKRDLYDLAIGALDFYARRGQGLGTLHAAHHAAHSMPIARHDFYIAFAVERLQRRQGFGHFHSISVATIRLVRLTILGRVGFVNSGAEMRLILECGDLSPLSKGADKSAHSKKGEKYTQPILLNRRIIRHQSFDCRHRIRANFVMQPQQKFSGSGFGSADQSGAIVCAQCGVPMPKEMRFCRSCGHRLGEGPAEYTETVRFPNATAAANGRYTSPYTPPMSAPMAQQTVRGFGRRRRRLGFSGMTWMWIVLGLFFASGGGLSMLVKNVRQVRGISATVVTTRSYLGVNGIRTGDGGVTFDVASPPDGPADKAGLVGGDIITSFDGHPVGKESEIMDLLRQTPIGKRVEVIYTRDGNVHNTQMTTISNDEMDQLREAFDNRPEGRGYFGFESYRTTRISIPETKTYGVRIDWVEANGAADLFGIKEGDIITDFDKVPIRTSDELLSRVRRATPKSVVEVVVLRDGQVVKIPVTMGRAR